MFVISVRPSGVFSVDCSEERTHVVYELAMTRLHEELLREFQEWSGTATTPKALMERISQRLHEKMWKYNWVGFYLVDPVDSDVSGFGARRQSAAKCVSKAGARS